MLNNVSYFSFAFVQLVEQDSEGQCNSECKTIERACQDVRFSESFLPLLLGQLCSPCNSSCQGSLLLFVCGSCHLDFLINIIEVLL